MLSILQISEKELMYHRKNFYETMKVHGIPCRISSISSSSVAYDFYQDIESTENSYKDAIDTLITYEELPTIKTLKSLGWYIEDAEFPAIAYIPVYYKDKFGKDASFSPSIDDRIDVIVNPYDRTSIRSERSFLLKDFKGNGFPSTIYYTCKMVPYREDIPAKTPVTSNP